MSPCLGWLRRIIQALGVLLLVLLLGGAIYFRIGGACWGPSPFDSACGGQPDGYIEQEAPDWAGDAYPYR